MFGDYGRAFAYDAWANREVLRVLEAIATAPAASVRWLAHIVGAQWTWHARLHASEARPPVWPDLPLGGVASELDRLDAAWRTFLADGTLSDPARRIRYVNTKGQPWESAVGDVLSHVIVHSAYHRGQIAADVRRAGFDPAYTDFIQAVRSGAVGGE